MSVAPVTQTSIVNVNNLEPQVNYKRQKIINYALRISVLVTFIGAVLATYLVNYKKNLKRAEQFFLYVTPSSDFFKIWPVIYSLLLVVVLHNTKNNIWKTKSMVIYSLSNLTLIIQSIIWQFRNIPGVVIGGLFLATVDNLTIYFWRVLLDQYLDKKQIQDGAQAQQNLTQNITQNEIQNRSQIILKPKRIKSRRYTQVQLFLVRNVISLYIGWVTVTGTVIVGQTIVYWWGWSLCLQFILFWITTPIAAIALYAFLAWKVQNQSKYSWGYVFGIFYGLTGAAIASIDQITSRGQC